MTHRYRDTRIQITEIQIHRYIDTRIQRYRDILTHTYRDTQIQRYIDTQIQRYRDTLTHRYIDTHIQITEIQIQRYSQYSLGLWAQSVAGVSASCARFCSRYGGGGKGSSDPAGGNRRAAGAGAPCA